MSFQSRKRKVTAAPTPAIPKDIFTANNLESLARDMKSKRIPLKRSTVTDPLTPGLSAVVRDSGLITYHVQYVVGEHRPMLKISDHPADIEDLRNLARTIKHLASLGIDPQEGLHERLIKELREKGTKWRP